MKLAAISKQIWDMKYRLKKSGVTPDDMTLSDTWLRVATALSKAEKDPGNWVDKFYEAQVDFKFLPAGRIIAGAGTGRRVTLFNCFVMGTIPDNLSSIFEHLREAALTMQQGGGIGYDFSTLRPKGALVKGVDADASGPLSFMDVWDAMCRTILSAGYRRGAMMATLACDHPDIEAFIDAKREPKRLRMFNLSVLVSDAFMKAVEINADWPLQFGGKVFKTIKAAELWDRIMRATYAYAEPGVIFIDRINKRNNLYYCEDIRSTNPCGEQPLPPYGACLLGSINLAALVRQPFTSTASIDSLELERLVGTAVRMLDNTIDVSGFPLQQQNKEARDKRRIGLGITGLADALIMLDLTYGSTKAAVVAGNWMAEIQKFAYRASAMIAAEQGAFPLYDKEKFLAGDHVRTLDVTTLELIAIHGIRNSLLTSIAPTGTISLFANNVSSGIEPVFSFKHTRKVLQKDGSRTEEEITAYSYRLFREMFGENRPLPAAFVDAQTLTPSAHLVMQAAIQPYVDSSISKTINVPEDIGFDDFRAVYTKAYELGCKGCTTFRPNDITGSILTVSDDKPKPAAPAPAPGKPPRPEVLVGKTYKLKWGDSEHALYITINDVVDDAGRRPFEIFINSKNIEHYAWIVALTRMISAVFRRGGDVSFVSEELKAVFDPRGGHWLDKKFVPSVLAAIGGIIERHMGGGEAKKAGGLGPWFSLQSPAAELLGMSPKQCPKCGQPGLMHKEGCESCPSCDYTKC